MEDRIEEVTYTLNCDNCGEVFYSSEGFPSPQLCPKCLKPDEVKRNTAADLEPGME